MSYYGGAPMEAWGSGAAMSPRNFVVPLWSLMHIFLNHNKEWPSLEDTLRNMQNVAAI
jgi:hypothetical protein